MEGVFQDKGRKREWFPPAPDRRCVILLSSCLVDLREERGGSAKGHWGNCRGLCLDVIVFIFCEQGGATTRTAGSPTTREGHCGSVGPIWRMHAIHTRTGINARTGTPWDSI